jgi:uncharacterized protein YbcI
MSGAALTGAISAAMVGLYRDYYGHDRATATTYLNDDIVVCVLEDILTGAETSLLASGASAPASDGAVSFQTATQDEFTAVTEGLTERKVIAFLSADATTPGVACELFFLDPAVARPADAR